MQPKKPKRSKRFFLFGVGLVNFLILKIMFSTLMGTRDHIHSPFGDIDDTSTFILFLVIGILFNVVSYAIYKKDFS